MKAIDIGLLPALDALLTSANVTKAAARLGISQPALSTKLARLRDVTGDALLVPSGKGRGMVLTSYALGLRGRVGSALAAVEQALGDGVGFDPATDEATFRVIANDNAASLGAVIILAKLAEHEARHVRVAFLRPDGRRIADRLENGDADLAISAEPTPTGGERLHRHAICSDRYVTARRKGHPLGAEPFDLDAFCTADHVIVSDTGDFDGSIDAALRALGRERRVTLSLASYLLVPPVVAQSDLVATLPRRLFNDLAHRLVLSEPPIALREITLSAFWHERTDGDAANRWLRTSLFQSTSSPAQASG